MEVMGRNAGWLTAASALSRVNGGEGPSLIYLCEPVFDTEQFLKDVQENWNRRTVFWLQSARASMTARAAMFLSRCRAMHRISWHSYIAGSAKVLEELVRDRIGL